jgi:positive regulator of sigma E activity
LLKLSAMSRIEHIGTVTEVTEDKAVVELRDTDRCCGMGLRCACCASVQSERRRIRVPRGDLERGDMVCVSIPARAAYVGMFVVFVLPVLLFVLGAGIGWLVRGRAAGNDIPIIIGGLCGFVLAVIVAVLVNRKMASTQDIQVRRVREGQP